MPPTLNDFFTVGCVMFFNLHFVCFCLGFSFEFSDGGDERNWKQKCFPFGPFFVALTMTLRARRIENNFLKLAINKKKLKTMNVKRQSFSFPLKSNKKLLKYVRF